MRRMSTIVVPRASFSIEDPWMVPPACEPVRLVRSTDGTAPRLATSVSAYRDAQAITFVFASADDHIVARYYGHDDPLWEHDAVEVFLAPERLTEYFEVEVNPLGTAFDARIESPDGHRGTMRTFLDFTVEGLFAAVRREVESSGAMTVETVIRIPFTSIGGAPESGTEWRANLFRIDRHPEHGDEFTSWQPTMKDPADFHVPSAFGVLRFA